MQEFLPKLWHFLNSAFFVAIVTVAAGSFAYLIYKKQKGDSKEDAANIILLEIQNAERQVKFIKELMATAGGKLPEEVIILPISNWNAYKYLFVRDFDRDSWDGINEFYNKCRLLDEALEANKSFFQKNEVEIRANRTRILMDYLKDKIDDPTNEATIETKRQQFIETCIDTILLYEPNKPVGDAKKLLADIGTGISQTIIGTKLRALAKD